MEMICIRYLILEVSRNHSLFPNGQTKLYLELRQENEEKELDAHSYVQIIKDALHLNKSVCLARNFHQLQKDEIEMNRRKVFVDIWPVRSQLITNTFMTFVLFRSILSFRKRQPSLTSRVCICCN